MSNENRRGRAGQPGPLVGSWTRGGQSADTRIPINLERLLLRAARSERFKELLFSDREQALADLDVALLSSERAMLLALPVQALESMIAGLRPKTQRNRVFVKQVAAAVAGSMIISASCMACGGDDGDVWYDSGPDSGDDAGDEDGGAD
jgi:hypothetical protein